MDINLSNNNQSIIDLNVGKDQKYATISSALKDCQQSQVYYNINLDSGIYEEILTLPENCCIQGKNGSYVVIKSPNTFLDEDEDETELTNDNQINALITCNHNTTINNLNIELNNIDIDSQLIGINSQNKNNILIENISIYQSVNNLSLPNMTGVRLYGGEYHQLDNININFNLGFGFINGIIFDTTRDVRCLNSNINISSPNKRSLGITFNDCSYINNVFIEYCNIKISNSIDNLGIYCINSSFNMNYSTILINSNDNMCHCIYLSNKDIFNNDYKTAIELDDIFVKLLPDNLLLIDNKIVFNSNDDDEDDDLKITFQDLGYEANDIVDFNNNKYRIINVLDNELVIEIQEQEQIVKPTNNLDLLKKLNQIYISYNTISTEQSFNSKINNVIFIEDFSLKSYRIFERYNNLFGNKINTRLCLVENNQNNKIKQVSISDEYNNLNLGMIISIDNSSSENNKGKISKIKNDKLVIGIYSHSDKNDMETIHNLIVSGECLIWVSNISGKVNYGDYITSSNLEGIGMLQNDDIYHNYTIGKCVQNVNWSDAIEYIEVDNKLFCKMLLKVLITTT